MLGTALAATGRATNLPGTGITKADGVAAMRRPTAAAPRRIDIPGSFDNVDMSTIGGRIAWARLRKELTQVDLGKMVVKSRATIVQYEQNNITPPVEVIETLARHLGVEPEFIAFGKQGITGMRNATEEVVIVPEVTFGKDGEYASGGYGLPRKMADQFGVSRTGCKVYVLGQDATAFDLRAGDRLITDTKADSFSPHHDYYLVRTGGRAELIRREPAFEGNGKKVTIVTANGKSHVVDPTKIEFIGTVIGSVRQN
jgi:DNA-binding XRE family transcriptional regulator